MKLFKSTCLFAALSAAFFFGCGDNSASSDVIEEYSQFQDGSSSSIFKSSSSQVSTSEAWRDSCIEIINSYRESVNATRIVRNVDKESCTDSEAADDLRENSAHGHFGNCGEFAQNSGPNITTAYYSDEFKIVKSYLDMMWKEKELADAGDTIYTHIGHYLNMKNSRVKSVACGIAYSEDGKTAWFNVNFF